MSESSITYAAKAGVLLAEFTLRVRQVRPDSTVTLRFDRADNVVIEWDELVLSPAHHWGQVFAPEVFDFPPSVALENLWTAWTNQVQRKLFQA